MGTGDSNVASVFETLTKKIDQALSGSRIAEFAQQVTTRTQQLVQNSYLYRWLTKEPEPDVIVIDLRETYTVGPFIAILDRVILHVERAWAHSRLNAFLTAVFGPLFETLSETRTYTLAVKLLEPPEPPESRTNTDEENPKKD